MRRLRMILWTVLVSCLLAGVATASSASAAYFSGTLTIGSAPPCDFEMTTTVAPPPPASQTLLGSTFVGDPFGPSGNPCNLTGTTISDLDVSFAIDGSHFDAIASPPFRVVSVFCTYSATASLVMHGGANIYGPYGGSTSLAGSPSSCPPMSFTLSNFEYNP